MKRLLEMIEKCNTISIVGHIRPDGDCIGSSLGMYNYIMDNYPGKRVDVYLQPIMDKFKFLNGALDIINTPSDQVYELSISVDCSDTDRHGEFADIFKNAKNTVCIDHHRSNMGFGDLYYCDPDASSACEVVSRFFDMDKISKSCAEALYMGIIHDTGVLKYSATSDETMFIVGKLIAKGIDTQYIIDETFYRVRYTQNRLTGKALMDSELYLDGKVIASCIREEDFQMFGSTKEDTDGIIDKLRVTEGIEVAILGYQTDEGKFKFSLRSVSKVDVSTIAVELGGGGHIRASGVWMDGSYEESLDKILKMIEKQL